MPPLMLGVNGPLQMRQYPGTQVEHLKSLTADLGKLDQDLVLIFLAKRVNERVQHRSDSM